MQSNLQAKFGSKKVVWGPIFIMIAASLWAVDGIFRTQLTYALPTAAIVLFEHILGFIFLSPIFILALPKLRKVNLKTWALIFLMALVSGTLGTILFTESLARSFAQGDFATPILLQKLQPLFVVLLSAIFLKEKITLRFLGLALLALIGSYMISFGTDPVQLQLAGKELVYVLAIGAAFAWGLGTILSKNILKTLSFPEATAVRFAATIPIAFIFSLVLNQTYNYATLDSSQIWRFIVIAAVTGGAGAILIYYLGLKTTKARVATFAELAFPVTAIFIATTELNPYGEPQQLTLANILGIVILLVSILLISSTNKENENV